MRTFWRYCYSFIIIPAMWVALQVVGTFNSKVRRGIRGRKDLLQQLATQLATLPPGPRVWFHSSSLGEFEQAKPIIEELKRRRQDVRIIASFFSPSGYEHSKKYHAADVLTYIPFDTRGAAAGFLDIVRPDVAVMVRYDVWPNHIWELRRRGIPAMIANATMQRRTPRRVPVVRNFHHHVYDAIDRILTVSESDVECFGKFGLTHATVEAIGDTRYDQVLMRSVEARKRHLIPPEILAGRRVVVVGSSWPEDEEVVVPALIEVQRSIPGLLVVLVPHEPTVDHLEDLEESLRGHTRSIRFSALHEYDGQPFIIVDSVGVLLVLYAYAHLAYVGGSFRQGVHNVLEAAVFGIPVLFGPRHRNSHEPLMLVERGGAVVVNNREEFIRTTSHLLENEPARVAVGERAARFVQSNARATERFLRHLEPYLHPPKGPSKEET